MSRFMCGKAAHRHEGDMLQGGESASPACLPAAGFTPNSVPVPNRHELPTTDLPSFAAIPPAVAECLTIREFNAVHG